MTTFSDLFTFSRSGSATYVDSTGTLQTAADGEPRTGHHVWDGSQWVNEGLLIESESRTNLITYSEDFTDASWQKFSTGTGSSPLVTSNFALAPDGVSLADRVVFALNGGTESADQSSLVNVLDAPDPHTRSVWMKSTDGVSTYDLTLEITGPSNQVTVTGQWKRFYLPGALNQNFEIGLRGSYSPNDTADVLIWGAQVEAAFTPSSYIPTSGSTVTRAAETLTAPSANLPWSSSAVSIAMEGTMTYADEDRNPELVFVGWQSDVSNRIITRLRTDGGNIGLVQFLQQETGTLDAVSSSSNYHSPGVNVPFSIASRHGATFLNGAVDGTALTEDTTPTALPDLSSTDLEIASDFMGTIKSLRIWADDLGDSGIEEASS